MGHGLSLARRNSRTQKVRLQTGMGRQTAPSGLVPRWPLKGATHVGHKPLAVLNGFWKAGLLPSGRRNGGRFWRLWRSSDGGDALSYSVACQRSRPDVFLVPPF